MDHEREIYTGSVEAELPTTTIGSLKQNRLLKTVSKKELETALGKWFTNARDKEGNRALRAQRDHDRRAVQPEVCAAEESA
ncbi:hypothetical protein C0J45_5720 [Silurus meridionalis]|nr:hypothetical protein C0J45_5720 [Silurus meridionalis]